METYEILMDIRERMVRVETKLDAQSGHEDRIKTLETEATQLRSSVTAIKWVGGALVTIVSLFGDSLLQAFA